MKQNLEKVKTLVRDLRDDKEGSRKPRETLGGYALAARAVDKCRAVLLEWEGEYLPNCPLDQWWHRFAGVEYEAFKSCVATGATDQDIAQWIGEHARNRPRARSMNGTSERVRCGSAESLHYHHVTTVEIVLTYLPTVRRVPKYRQDMIVSQLSS